MITLVVKIKAKSGQKSALQEVTLRMAKAVQANEPGNALFVVGDGPDEDSLILVERYRDQQAIDAHRGMEHFKTIGREMGQFMDGRPEVLVRIEEHE